MYDNIGKIIISIYLCGYSADALVVQSIDQYIIDMIHWYTGQYPIIKIKM